MKRNLIRAIITALFCLCFVGFARTDAKADEAGKISVGDIDYERLTMKVYKNGNSNVYFSTTLANDLSGWDEVNGVAADDGKGTYLLVDISWASSASDVKFYLRGDKNTTATEVVLPKVTAAFRVSFDKVNGDFTFSGQEDRTYFFYRKSTDYNWIKVYFEGMGDPAPGNPSEVSYATFLSGIDMLRFKGAKLLFRIGQQPGTDENDTGARPSKEVAVTVSKYASAPSVKLNVTKLTFNTKTTMEWSDDMKNWHECEKNMELKDLAPAALIGGKGGAASDVTLFFRLASTEKKPCSQISVVVIPAQTAAPSVGKDSSSEVSYSYSNNKLLLRFSKASATNMYEYCIVGKGAEFSESTAKWKTIKAAKTVSITKKSAEDATIYVRYKGTLENIKKGIPFRLPSACSNFAVNGFQD